MDYLAATKAALGRVPTQNDIVFERFFDEAGDQHLVIHSPYGSRVNRAWGLGLRKRFCRQFNFELQAAALEDSIVISLGATHSFPLQDATHFVHSNSIREVVTQAMLAAPMFPTHWRWNATIALAIRRNNAGKKVPPTFQRMDAEDLMAVVFPDQLACQDNIVGEREIPEHPLVEQTIDDCLTDLMDIEGLKILLRKIESKEVRIHCCDLSGPSPLSHEILTARPYAFLDDAPAEERRTQAVVARRFTDPEDAAKLASLNPAAIKQVEKEAWPDVVNSDELHDAMHMLGLMTDAELRGNNPHNTSYLHLLEPLLSGKRVTCLKRTSDDLWVCAERLNMVSLLYPGAVPEPAIEPVPASSVVVEADTALRELVRARLECSGPVRDEELATLFAISPSDIKQSLLMLENEGYAMRGNYTGQGAEEWCERGLLARMHRYTMKSLRREIQPVSSADYMRFLFQWHGMGDMQGEGEQTLLSVIERLQGFPISAAAWERDILPARIHRYRTSLLDQICTSGQVMWTRLSKSQSEKSTSKANLLRNTPVTLLERETAHYWQKQQNIEENSVSLSGNAAKILQTLSAQGASFFNDIVKCSGILRTHCEEALAELAACGLITSDSYAGLRALITPNNKRPSYARTQRRGRGKASVNTFDNAGRWSLIEQKTDKETTSVKTSWMSMDDDSLNFIAHVLLLRYGVVFRKVLERESMLPPWRDLLYTYRRMEARGEIRGGRFVEGFSGEQFALPDAVGLLRKQRNKNTAIGSKVISATDPLNLVGIIIPGEKISALHTNRVLFKNGLPVAKQLNNEILYLDEVSSTEQWAINNLLTRKQNPAGFIQNRSPYSN